MDMDWAAHLVGGKVVRRDDVGLMKDIAPGSVERFAVLTDHQRFPRVDVDLQPEQGNFAGAFVRRMRGVNGRSLDAVVIEVVSDPAEPDRYVRLYLLSDGRIVLSTKDLYF